MSKAAVATASAFGATLAFFVITVVWLITMAPTWPRFVVALVALILGATPISVGWPVLMRGRASAAPGTARVGAILLGMGLAPILVAVTDLWAGVSADQPGRLWVSGLAVAAMPMVWSLLYVAPALLLAHFPTGYLPNRRWRWVMWSLSTSVPLLVLSAALMPGSHDPPFEWVEASPLALPSEWEALATALFVVGGLDLLAGLAGSTLSLITRRRRATATDEYAQLRWLGLTAFSLPLTLILCWAGYLLFDGPHLAVLGIVFFWLSVPALVWISLLQRDLFDIDRFATIARTATIVGIVALSLWMLVAVSVASLIGRDSPLVVAGLTAVLVAGLVPFRRRCERWVDRRLAPRRAATRDALDKLLADVHDGEEDPEALGVRLHQGLRGAGRSGHEVRVGYVVPGRTHVWDRRGNRIELDQAALGIRLGGQHVAWIGDLTPQERLVVVDLERRVAMVAQLARLRIGVTMAMTEGEEARQLLESSAESERHRLGRDLHDGAQQRLIALGLDLRMAQRRLPDLDAALYRVLDSAVVQLGDAVTELRQLAQGLGPGSLDSGLAAALAPLARAGPVPVTVRVTGAPLSRTLASAAYYVVLEAVTNAFKHAQPSRVDVIVEQVGAQLTVRVSDDGRGGADPLGSGWTGLMERVTALGGRLHLASPTGVGTTLEVLLPYAATD